MFLIQSAGIQEQNAPKRFIRIKRSVLVEDGDKWARFDPFTGFKVEFPFDHPLFKGRRPACGRRFLHDILRQEVDRARTFGFMRDLEYLRERRLALGRWTTPSWNWTTTGSSTKTGCAMKMSSSSTRFWTPSAILSAGPQPDWRFQRL